MDKNEKEEDVHGEGEQDEDVEEEKDREDGDEESEDSENEDGEESQDGEEPNHLTKGQVGLAKENALHTKCLDFLTVGRFKPLFGSNKMFNYSNLAHKTTILNQNLQVGIFPPFVSPRHKTEMKLP